MHQIKKMKRTVLISGDLKGFKFLSFSMKFGFLDVYLEKLLKPTICSKITLQIYVLNY